MRGRRIGDTRLDAAAGFDNLWEINGEGSSLPGFTANLDVAAALLDDAVDGGETEAGTVAAFLGGEKRLENTGESGIVHAAAGVADGENDEGAGLAIGESSGGVFVEIDGRSFQRDAAALGMASLAFSTRLVRTCSSWMGSTLMEPRERAGRRRM